ncbi:FAD/FMN-containing dehydrogenase [Kribbella orskensis]|uniref:FAD/FMN-containing dehydrogenase n=1 Tax=Kribbella orskensis TaxID=2512216 RepID=A0ABY2BDT4_9ACTN|nr:MULTISPECIES: FAD-binding oxidoreductase [Kribbella]TCN35390.1 FAD/FMN-containing dehydrogenase [Kribbella sp. VKM Ac-2500]TCO16811.1 FAD/FMN-containing dehydrogenase [Kribbella orskensis]
MSDTVWRPLRAHGARPEGFGGVVLWPGDPAYEAARVVFNAMIDKRPAVIAQCESAADVAAAVRFGVAEGLEIAVRGAGHSVAGTGVSDGGLVIDLRKMRSVQLDPDARIVRVGGGATWGDLDGACWPYALATTGGRVSTTGVAGLTLGGGSGWLERKFGLACDSLVSVELVTATGELVIADDTRNRELFWALHGGGGNFGVATALTLRVRPLPGTALGRLFWPADAGPAVMRAYRDLFEGGAPEELGGSVFYSAAPIRDYVPPGLQGRPAVGVTATYTGSEAQLRSALAPVIDLAPEGMMLAELSYAEIQSALDDPPGLRNYWSAEHLESWPDEAVDVFSARAPEMPSPETSQQLVCPWGGAVARYADRWPLPHRRAPWVVQSYGVWADPAEDARGIAWARNVCADLKPYSTGSVYLNFIGDEGPERVKAAFGDHYDRLARVKAEFDPGNVFHLNQNIKPA